MQRACYLYSFVALSTSRLVIPPRDALVKIDAEDPLDYYYRPGTAILYRARLAEARRLLGSGRYESLLDIGYGSGIFIPELARIAHRVAGIDVHARADEVARSLAALGVDADLREASLFDLPYADGEFDAVVSISVFEHLVDLDGALAELTRVLRPGGVAVLGFPVRNVLTDVFFRLAGYNPRAIHPSGHREILGAVDRASALELERYLSFPRLLPLPLAAYTTCRCRRT
jgi:SAM-dependent methyltransferase